MGNHNLLKLVLGTLVIIAVTAGGGCEFISGGADSLPIITPTPDITSTAATTTFENITTPAAVLNKSPSEIYKMLLTSSYPLHLIDVRTPEEYAAGHIDDADNIDLISSDFEQTIDKQAKEAYYVVYCRTGARSAKASDIMVRHGFIHVINMTGGITEWLNENLDNVERPLN
jgi:phage shock protein E